MGKPGFPMPLRAGGARPTPPGAGAWVRGPPARIRAGAVSTPTHPLGEGVGKPGFPMPLRAGGARPTPPAGRGLGARASGPHPHAGGARPTPPAGRGLGARASGPHPRGRRIRAGGVRPPVRVWGNPASPDPCLRAAPSL